MTHSSLPAYAREAVLAAVAYADYFSFPPKTFELKRYIFFIALDDDQIEQVADELVAAGRLVRHAGYLCFPGREEIIAGREERLALLAEYKRLIKRKLPSLLRFGFIRGAMLSGSLAADAACKRCDVDLFLILDHRRMWLGFLLVRLIRLLERKVEICPNYIVSDRSLELVHPNVFTAVEMAKAVPLKPGPVLDDLDEVNCWYRDFIPNALTPEQKTLPLDLRPRWWHRLLDGLVASPFGGLLDKLEYRRLNRRTGGLYQPRDKVFKPHPPQYQHRLMEGLTARMRQYHIRFPQLENHLREQLAILEPACRHWREPVRRRLELEYAVSADQ
ncbi:MAG: hypothetical protein QNK37_05335 [Acidobacteriota bacterium]|nr:hypothetical protein [Acidobacteriota bacterium]